VPAAGPYGQAPTQQGLAHHAQQAWHQGAPPHAGYQGPAHGARPGIDSFKKEAQDAFIRADVDGSRSLDPREFMECLQRLGYSINYPEALRLFGSVDTNQDGKIRMEEFVELYVTLKTNNEYP
jgi:hypothetical protein